MQTKTIHLELRAFPRRWAWSLALWCGLAGAVPPISVIKPQDQLAQYVAASDSSFEWHEIARGRVASVEYVELRLVSQTWRDVPWKHQLIIFRPEKLPAESTQALLYVHGSRWRPEYDTGKPVELPREARLFARLAKDIRAPVAVIRQVPFQPMFERREDALIAYTFDQYLKTGEPDWPLLLPMVKSVARSMDAVQAYSLERWQSRIERFTVTGASKRGWTAWLTAAIDPRVASVAPMVIDMLNIPEQIALQRATFGRLSDEVQDYADIDLAARIDTQAGRDLLAIVDPYSYRSRLTQPKLILLGTNDRYWPLDAMNVYWDGLPEPKNALYIPNQGHSLRDIERLIGSLSALHRYSARGEELPEISWSFASRPGRLEAQVQAERRPYRVRAWTAHSPLRGFRDVRWRSHDCKRSTEGFRCSGRLRGDLYTALYAEVVFKDSGATPFSLSTAVCIAGGPGTADTEC